MTTLNLVNPLRKCVLRCDPYMHLVVGGTYGYTRSAGAQFHGGIDLYAEQGTECYAIYKGQVEWISDFKSKGWGLAVLCKVDHPEWNCWALYAHLSNVFLKKGARLEPRTLIGLTGISGNGDSKYPHLHFEIWKSMQAGTHGTKEKFRTDPLDVLGPLPFVPFASEVIERNQQIRRTV